jgi:hypothetical protein
MSPTSARYSINNAPVPAMPITLLGFSDYGMYAARAIVKSTLF